MQPNLGAVVTGLWDFNPSAEADCTVKQQQVHLAQNGSQKLQLGAQNAVGAVGRKWMSEELKLCIFNVLLRKF